MYADILRDSARRHLPNHCKKCRSALLISVAFIFLYMFFFLPLQRSWMS